MKCPKCGERVLAAMDHTVGQRVTRMYYHDKRRSGYRRRPCTVYGIFTRRRVVLSKPIDS